MRFEADEITLVGGIRHGRTLGSPVAIEIANTEWPKWTEEMSPAPGAPAKVLTQPRPVTPTWPGCRSTGSTMPATCWAGLGPGDRRPGGGGDAGQLADQPARDVNRGRHIVRARGGGYGTDSPRPGPADLGPDRREAPCAVSTRPQKRR